MSRESIEDRIKRLHANGIVDLHFDLLIDLYEKRILVEAMPAEKE